MIPGQEPTTGVRAWLAGESPDLQVLAHQLVDGDLRVVHDADEDAFYLTAPEMGKPAEVLLQRINGIAQVRVPNYHPVQLSGGYTDQDGNSTHVAEVKLEMRVALSVTASVVDADGKSMPDAPSPYPNWLALADSNPDVDQVLVIMGSEPLDWSKLFKVREIINDSVKSVQGEIKYQPIVGMGWTDKRTDSSFTGSANHEKVSGDEARHARSSSEPPANPMTIDQGRDYIRNLVTRWLDWLRAT